LDAQQWSLQALAVQQSQRLHAADERWLPVRQLDSNMRLLLLLLPLLLCGATATQ